MQLTPPGAGRRAVVLANLALLAAYLIAGRLGLLLALPPGYASPIFLPAGIALAACAVGGMRLLPAVALGALGVNLVPTWQGLAGIAAPAPVSYTHLTLPTIYSV